MLDISIIMPIYNMQAYISKALDSVLSQKKVSLEVICINDGSTDQSAQIICDYCKRDSRILLKSIENSGAGFARNIGIKCATGKYLAFLDPDDWYPDEMTLHDLIKSAETNNSKIVIGKKLHCSKFFTLDKKLVSLKPDAIYNWWEIDNLFMYQCAVYSRRLILDSRVEFPNYRRFQDPPFFLRALISANKFYFIDRYVYCYRREGQTFTWSVDKLIDYLSGVSACARILSGYAQYSAFSALSKQLVQCLNDDSLILGLIAKANDDVNKLFIKTAQEILILDRNCSKHTGLRYLNLVSDSASSIEKKRFLLLKAKLMFKQWIKKLA